MSKYTSHVRCTHPGCNETAIHGYDTLKERREADLRRHKAPPYRCLRHGESDLVLTPENLTSTVSREIVATFATGIIADQLFWHDGESLGSGFAHGDAFKAWAQDFPPGTKIVITSTARVELPESSK